MPDQNVYEEVRDCRADIAALSIMVASNAAETRRAFAGIEQLLIDAKKELAELKQILSAVTPPVAVAIVFGWNGDLRTYPIPTDSNEVIKMSDFSLPDSDSAAAPFKVVDADGNIIPQTSAPTVTQDVSTFGTAAAAAAANNDGSWNITFVPTTAEGVGPTNVTVQAADSTVPAASSVVTTDLTAGTTATAVWSDTGLTVTAAPPASDTPPASA